MDRKYVDVGLSSSPSIVKIPVEEIKNLKNKKMMDIETDIEKLRKRKQKIMDDITTGITDNHKRIAKEENITIGEDIPLRPLSNEEVARVEEINGIIFERKQKLLAEKIKFLSEEKALLEKEIAAHDGKVDALEMKLSEAQTEREKVKIRKSTLNSYLTGQQKIELYYQPIGSGDSIHKMKAALEY